MIESKSPGAVAALGASEIDQLGGKVFPEVKRQNRFAQAPIRAGLVGSSGCKAGGVIARSLASVLDLCRRLPTAGYDPASPFEAWRGETLCLCVFAIGEAAQPTVADDRYGTATPSTPGAQGYVGASPVGQIAGRNCPGAPRHDRLRWQAPAGPCAHCGRARRVPERRCAEDADARERSAPRLSVALRSIRKLRGRAS